MRNRAVRMVLAQRNSPGATALITVALSDPTPHRLRRTEFISAMEVIATHASVGHAFAAPDESRIDPMSATVRICL